MQGARRALRAHRSQPRFGDSGTCAPPPNRVPVFEQCQDSTQRHETLPAFYSLARVSSAAAAVSLSRRHAHVATVSRSRTALSFVCPSSAPLAASAAAGRKEQTTPASSNRNWKLLPAAPRLLQAGHPFDVILQKVPASSPHKKAWDERIQWYANAFPAAYVVGPGRGNLAHRLGIVDLSFLS